MWPPAWGGWTFDGIGRARNPVRAAPPGAMTNGVALFLGLLILAALVGDAFLTGGEGALFIARRFVALIEWARFWR